MAVTANQPIVSQNQRSRRNYPVAASTRLYGGTLCFLTAAGGFADDDIAAGANHFGGIVIEDSDNSSGSNGDKRVEVFTEGAFQMAGSGFTQALVGDKIYAVDNFAVNATATNQTLVGRCVEFISSTLIMVEIECGIQA